MDLPGHQVMPLVARSFLVPMENVHYSSLMAGPAYMG